MKRPLKLIVAIFVVAFAPAHAQSLIPKTDAQRIAEQIDTRQVNMVNFIESQLLAFYNAVNTPGQQQAVFDSLGVNAVLAVQRYDAMRTLLLQLKPSANVPAPDPSVFLLNQNGTVTYVAPPAEVEPE